MEKFEPVANCYRNKLLPKLHQYPAAANLLHGPASLAFGAAIFVFGNMVAESAYKKLAEIELE